jgi:hypothetical protein
MGSKQQTARVNRLHQYLTMEGKFLITPEVRYQNAINDNNYSFDLFATY